MIQCIGGHLPVCKVQLVDETTKFGVVCRNLLFPLAMTNASDTKQQIMEVNESKLTDLDGENEASSEQINNYEGPVTRSKTKEFKNTLLFKGNMLISNHFNDE